MATMTITGSAFVLKSEMTLGDLNTLAKYAPEKMEIRDDKGQLVFKASVAATGNGDITPKAIYFAPVTHDPDGLATVTFDVPSDVTDVKEWAADEFGAAYFQLNTLEDAMSEALVDVMANRTVLMENINIQ